MHSSMPILYHPEEERICDECKRYEEEVQTLCNQLDAKVTDVADELLRDQMSMLHTATFMIRMQEI